MMPSHTKKNGLLKRNIKRNSNYSTTTFSHLISLLSNLLYHLLFFPCPSSELKGLLKILYSRVYLKLIVLTFDRNLVKENTLKIDPRGLCLKTSAAAQRKLLPSNSCCILSKDWLKKECNKQI